LRKKYALEGDFRFRCPHHQVIHDLLFARVPILPEELDKLQNTIREIEAHTEYLTFEQRCAIAENVQLAQCNEPMLTIRRKLESGGYAEPEQAIYLDGRYYSTEWIKSGPGILPQQVEIVK
jgi:phenylpropionate dioxygenase-like ring-hydroxylating dioxygenase large terminal subunit